MANNLGKGLEALIKSHSSNNKEKYLSEGISIENIIPNKNQPRKLFDTKQLSSLIESIKNKGILQPITVRYVKNNKFELISGERRWRAAKKAGLLTIPAYVLKINQESEMMEFALIENIQRVDLNPMEEAQGYLILKEKYNLTHQMIAKYVSKSRTEVSNKIRLIKLPNVIKDSLINGYIEYGHARSLLSLKKQNQMLLVYKKIIELKLTVRQTEALVKTLAYKKTYNKTFSKKSEFYDKIEVKLQNLLDTKTIIKEKNHKGKIIITFSSKKKLNDIILKIISNE